MTICFPSDIWSISSNMFKADGCSFYIVTICLVNNIFCGVLYIIFKKKTYFVVLYYIKKRGKQEDITIHEDWLLKGLRWVGEHALMESTHDLIIPPPPPPTFSSLIWKSWKTLVAGDVSPSSPPAYKTSDLEMIFVSNILVIFSSMNLTEEIRSKQRR